MKKVIVGLFIFTMLSLTTWAAWGEDCEQPTFQVGDKVRSSPGHHNPEKAFRGTVKAVYKRHTGRDLVEVCVDGELRAYSAFWLVHDKPEYRFFITSESSKVAEMKPDNCEERCTFDSKVNWNCFSACMDAKMRGRLAVAEPDCHWEWKRMYIVEDVEGKLSDGWEPFSATDNILWLKRRVCE